jgi:hypothetical protein
LYHYPPSGNPDYALITTLQLKYKIQTEECKYLEEPLTMADFIGLCIGSIVDHSGTFAAFDDGLDFTGRLSENS